jgi:hypothetical protein
MRRSSTTRGCRDRSAPRPDGSPELLIELGGLTERVDWFAVRAGRKRRHRTAGAGFSASYRRSGQRFERGGNASRAMRNARDFEAHLDAAERAGEHQIVERAEMSDAKHLAGKLAEAGAKGHVEIVEDHLRRRSALWPSGV